MQHARLAAFWTVAGVLGTLAVFPYALAINPAVAAQLPVPLPALVAAQTAQTGILLLLLSWIGLRLGQPLGLDSPFARALAGRRTAACARSAQASSTRAPPNTSPCRPCATTPSSMHKCKCTWAFIY